MVYLTQIWIPDFQSVRECDLIKFCRVLRRQACDPTVIEYNVITELTVRSHLASQRQDLTERSEFVIFGQTASQE